MAQPRLFETISWHETVIRSNMPVKRDCGTGVASPVSLFRAATPYLISLGRAKPPLLCHQGIQMALFGLFGKKQEQAISWPEVAGRIAGMLLTALCFSTMGTLFAAYPTESPGDIMSMLNLVRLPLIFVSGTFIALEAMPPIGKAISFLSPLTYGNDLIQAAYGNPSYFSPVLDVAMLILFFIIFQLIAHHLYAKFNE